MKVLKKIAGIAFAIAFLMAIVLFTNIGHQYISIANAKIIFIGAGAVGLLLNLITFQSGKHNAVFNFIYWIGSIILFVGLVFLLMRWPNGFYILVAGVITLGVSILLPTDWITPKSDDSDLLDNID
ncbi:MAG: hypothetical protein JKY09_01040 [Crocinitomicaceae bacterium]|nr:hypothetical protein [Crocinitomicaceae bacterium]